MISLVIDIRSDVVEGTLVDFSTEPTILYSTLAHIVQKPHSTGDYLTDMMIKAIGDIAAHIAQESQKYSKERISSVHYVLSSPWVMPQVKTIKVEYEKDTDITEAVVKKIITDAREELVKTYESDMVVVEEKIFAVELNGYPVQDYKGKKARTIQISFSFALSADEIIKKVKAAAGKTLHSNKEYSHSAILLQYLASRSKVSESADYAIVHIHGEVTDIVVVKKGISTSVGSFPFGASTLVRKVSHTLKNTFETASSTLSLHEEGKLESTQEEKMKAALAPLFTEWQSTLEKTCALPHTIHLSSGSPHLGFFKKSLEDSGFEVILDDAALLQSYTAVIKDMI